jgi:CHAT domain-containing protein
MVDHGDSITAIAAQYGPRDAINTGLGRAERALTADPDLAAQVITELWQITERHGDEFQKGKVLDLQLESLRRRAERLRVLARQDQRPRSRKISFNRWARTSRVVGGQHPAESGDPLTMLGAAADTLIHGDRSLGRDLVHAAIAIDPSNPGTAGTIHMYLVGQLYRAQAEDDERAGRYPEALTGYIQAAAVFSCCAFRARAMGSLKCTERLVGRNSDTAEAAILALARAAATLQRQLGSDAMTLTANLLRTSSGPSTRHLKPDIMLLREQVAKGLLFSAALADPQPVRVDDKGENLLRQIAVLSSGGAPAAASLVREVQDEFLLTSMVASTEMTAGQTAAERQINLQRSFDEYLTTNLYTAGNKSPFFNIDKLRTRLAPHMVFISLFVGVAPDAALAAVHAQAVTAKWCEYWLTPLPLPAAPVSRDVEDVTITYSAVADLVRHLRRQIQEDPMFDDVDPEAARHLGLLNVWLTKFSQKLPEWQKAGYKHLIIWPHGPTHYLPWHLYRAAGQHVPLADHWTITVLPAIGMLERPVARTGTGVVSVGCGKAGVPFGLPLVESLPPQAERVANALGTTALPEDEATPAQVAQTMPGARYIHIATHASQLAHAPAFQCLYLTPADNGEGRLFAYQIAALDLRGVQLVTLCACETGLGRFDIGDNLRGLSAAFLAAGASSVIAALWPVAADPASTFFSSLYENISAGCSAVSAFRAAQSATRQFHNEYRDWGAFAFIGDWRV